MKKLLIIADFNDGDYIKDVVKVEDDVFEKFLPLIKAINNFEPYVSRSGDVINTNWDSPRQDLGEKSVYEIYSQFSKDYIDEFRDIFMSGIIMPYYDGPFHTIVEISDVVTDEKYVQFPQSYEELHKRYNEKVLGYLKEYSELRSYTRPKDGKNICSIPFDEMTSEEKLIIDKMNSLWKKYQ